MNENLFGQLHGAGKVASTGSATIFGVEIALVTNVQDPQKLGRVKVCFPRMSGMPESDWARVVQPAGGPGRGFYWLPEVNDEVLVAFEMGQPNRPYVLRGLWNAKDKPMKDAYADDNTTRMIQTKSGHQIALYDKDGEEKITICDGSGKRVLTFDVKAKKLLIEAKEGSVELRAKKKIVLRSEEVEVHASKDAKLDIAKTFDLKIGGDGAMKAAGTFTLEGKQVQLNPSSLSVAALAGAVAGAAAGAKGGAKGAAAGAAAGAPAGAGAGSAGAGARVGAAAGATVTTQDVVDERPAPRAAAPTESVAPIRASALVALSPSGTAAAPAGASGPPFAQPPTPTSAATPTAAPAAPAPATPAPATPAQQSAAPNAGAAPFSAPNAGAPAQAAAPTQAVPNALYSAIDVGVIATHEGGSLQDGYVPAVNGVPVGQSGVTIGIGVDLGQQSVSGLLSMGVPQNVVNQLSPYVGLQRAAAQAALAANPLTLSQGDLDQLNNAVLGSYFNTTAASFNAANQSGFANFAALPGEAQTVIADLQYNMGPLAQSAPNFWNQVTNGRWNDAYQNLMNFTNQQTNPSLFTRAQQNATILQGAIQNGTLPIPTP